MYTSFEKMDYKYNKNMLIGIKGKIGVGKTESAKILKESFPFQEYAMADPIKKIGAILGFSQDELYGSQEQKLRINKHWGVSSREFLQKFGTDVCRLFMPTKIPQMKNLWVQCFEIFCEEHRDTNIIVSDVRFIDEADSIRKMGGIIIEIQRKEKEKENDEWEDVELHNPHGHVSETEMDGIVADFVVENNSDVKHLTDELTKIIVRKYLV